MFLFQVSDAFKDKISGLCGKYNGNPSDDLSTEAGQVVTSAAEFANSWKKTGLINGKFSLNKYD